MNDIIKKDLVDGMIDKVKGKGVGIRIETKEINVSVWDTSKGPVTNWEKHQYFQKPQLQENSSKEKIIELVKEEKENL